LRGNGLDSGDEVEVNTGHGFMVEPGRGRTKTRDRLHLEKESYEIRSKSTQCEDRGGLL